MGVMLIILPALLNGQEAYGTPALQNPAFQKACTLVSMRCGLYSVRVFWSFKHFASLPLPGIRDPFLSETYGPSEQEVDSPRSLVVCLFSKPGALPFYIGKKTIALFDEPHLHPYLVDETPPWFSELQRGFGAAAFCGFITLLMTLLSHPFLKLKPVWIGLPWATFVVLTIMVHGVMHVEGRYGFPAIPLSLVSLFLGFQELRRRNPVVFGCWIVVMLVAAGMFIYQVHAWDRVTPVWN